jgi:hypothetical protein
VQEVSEVSFCCLLQVCEQGCLALCVRSLDGNVPIPMHVERLNAPLNTQRSVQMSEDTVFYLFHVLPEI